MNTIIAIWHSGGKGKSGTILALANLLLSQYPNHNVIHASKDVNHLSADFSLIIEINGKTIALESLGDPNTGLEKRLDEIVKKHNPNLIICSSRTRGETVWAINNIAKKYSYDKIWTSTYQVTHSHKLANSLKGQHLLDLILKLGLV